MKQERGVVLAGVLVMLIVAGALIGGAFFYALQEERIGRNTQDAGRALAAAEAGADLAMGSSSGAALGVLAPGDSLSQVVPLPTEIGTATVTIHAIREELLLIRARGQDPTGSATREIDTLWRWLLPPFAAPAALVSATVVPASIVASVDGSDHPPSGWRCGPAMSNAAVAAPWSDPAGDWDSLAARATAGPGLPDAAHPVVLVDGDLSLTGGSGLGILLVSGDVVIDGGATLTGILVVQGQLRFSGAGGWILGAARVGSVVADPALLGGAPLVSWSSCAVLRARRSGAGFARIPGWSWSDQAGGW